MNHRMTVLGASLLALAAGSAFAQDGDLLVFDYSGFEDPAYHTTYTEKHGVSPTYAFFGDEEEAFQKLRSLKELLSPFCRISSSYSSSSRRMGVGSITSATATAQLAK